MKKLFSLYITLLCLLSFTGSPAFAAPKKGYELEVELFIDGAPVTVPRIKAIPGEKTTIIEKSGEEERFIEVLASEGQGQINGNKAIHMKFVVGTIKDGQRTVLAEPQIMTIEKKRAAIEIGHVEGKESINLSVTAERKTF